MGPAPRFKIILKLQQFPKYEKIDYTPVNCLSDWDRNMSWPVASVAEWLDQRFK